MVEVGRVVAEVERVVAVTAVVVAVAATPAGDQKGWRRRERAVQPAAGREACRGAPLARVGGGCRWGLARLSGRWELGVRSPGGWVSVGAGTQAGGQEGRKRRERAVQPAVGWGGRQGASLAQIGAGCW